MNLRELQTSNVAVVTVAEAATVLRVDVRTVSRAIESGEIPVVRLGRRILIPRLRLLALLGAETDADGPEGEAPRPTG